MMENKMDSPTRTIALVATLLGCCLAQPAWSAVSLGGAVNTTEQYGVTFDIPGITNPSYSFNTSKGTVEVSFGTHFVGQAFGASHNSLVDTTPTGPLQLANGNATTMLDLSNPNGVVLGGMAGNGVLTTPLAILFDQSVSFVSFDLGHLDSNTDAIIEAFDTSGASLGAFSGLPNGHNNFALAESEGTNTIAGISIYVPDHGMDWEGFAIDDVLFGIGEDGDVTGGGDPQVPEPATLVVWSLLGTIVGGCTWIKRRKA